MTTASQRKYFRLRRREQRAALQAQHLCVRCRRGPQPEGKATCADCIAVHVAKKRERRALLRAQKEMTMTMKINETGRSADRHEAGPRLPRELYDALARAYRVGNNCGNGYPVGERGDGPNGLDIGKQIHAASSDDEIAVYLANDGHTIAVAGGSEGPWAVDLDPEPKTHGARQIAEARGVWPTNDPGARPH